MKYKLILKHGLKVFGEAVLEVDPKVLDPIYQDEETDEWDLERMADECHNQMFDIEKAINRETELRAHIEYIEPDAYGYSKGVVVSTPSKEGKKHYDKLEKKWKKAEKKHSKKGKK